MWSFFTKFPLRKSFQTRNAKIPLPDTKPKINSKNIIINLLGLIFYLRKALINLFKARNHFLIYDKGTFPIQNYPSAWQSSRLRLPPDYFYICEFLRCGLQVSVLPSFAVLAR